MRGVLFVPGVLVFVSALVLAWSASSRPVALGGNETTIGTIDTRGITSTAGNPNSALTPSD